MLQLKNISHNKLIIIGCVVFLRVLTGIVLIKNGPDALLVAGILLIGAELFNLTKRAVE